MAIAVRPHAEGSLLAVRAQPGARKNAVVGEHGSALKIAVTAPPEDGRANDALIVLLQQWLGLTRSQVELANGRRSRSKQFLIRGLSPGELQALLAKKLA